MKTILMLALLATPICLAEESMAELVFKLADDDYDIREQATRKLAAYPAEYANTFLEMSDKETDPEVKMRLAMAARGVYINQTGCKTDEWLELHGTLQLEFERPTKRVQHFDENGVPTYCDWEVVARVVNWVCDETEKVIKQWDIVISIDDNTNFEYMKVLAGKEYTVKLRRYKEAGIEKISANSFETLEELGEFEELTVKVKGLWKEDRLVDQDKAYELMEKQWRTYFNEYRKAHPLKSEERDH